MRLLNVHTGQLEDFTGRPVPLYCVLSHRWGEDEVSYKEYRKGVKQHGAGYRKIVNFCKLVKNRSQFSDPGLRRNKIERCDWVWIDTCCIDKRSSAELSEAINSMYDWYHNASECYVYLSDVPASARSLSNTGTCDIGKSEWFTRGWTLQELLAPHLVVLCNANWEVFGHLEGEDRRKPATYHYHYGLSMLIDLENITKISSNFLTKRMRLDQASIAQRMSWASQRTTTRVEDEAYCLLGIFGINMPLLYGEGRRAFIRLQEEIIRRSTDQSLLSWGHDKIGSSVEVLADSPHRFAPASRGPSSRDANGRYADEVCHLFDRPYTITNNGLEVFTKLLVAEYPYERNPRFLLPLNYSRSGEKRKPTHIPLKRYKLPNIFERAFMTPENIRELEWYDTKEQLIYLRTGLEIVSSDELESFGLIDLSD